MRLPGYQVLVPIALLLGLAPFYPEPHIVEKVRMLLGGSLKRPIDVFDLFWHSWPFLLLICRLLVDLRRRGAAPLG